MDIHRHSWSKPNNNVIIMRYALTGRFSDGEPFSYLANNPRNLRDILAALKQKKIDDNSLLITTAIEKMEVKAWLIPSETYFALLQSEMKYFDLPDGKKLLIRDYINNPELKNACIAADADGFKY